MRRALIALLFLASPAVCGGVPTGLTGWRTPQGIFLTWTETPTGPFAVWRGTAPGSLTILATLQRGQVGFMDMGVRRETPYVYALGTGAAPGTEFRVDGLAAPVRILAALVTTCSGLSPGGTYPADTQNYFYPGKDRHVQFFGYFFLEPWDPAVRTARLVWKDATGAVFSEYSHAITPKRVELAGGTVGQLLLPQAIGLKDTLPQNGQLRIPAGPGMCTVEAFLDDVPIAMSVFYLKEQARAATALPRTLPASDGSPAPAPAAAPLP